MGGRTGRDCRSGLMNVVRQENEHEDKGEA